MEQKICLDTDLCIEIVKENRSVETIFEKYPSAATFISSITLFELNLRETNIEEIKLFVHYFQILPFTDLCAIKASIVSKDLNRKGLALDFRDIFIAVTCIVNNCSLLTLNKKHFENIEELKLIDI